MHVVYPCTKFLLFVSSPTIFQLSVKWRILYSGEQKLRLKNYFSYSHLIIILNKLLKTIKQKIPASFHIIHLLYFQDRRIIYWNNWSYYSSSKISICLISLKCNKFLPCVIENMEQCQEFSEVCSEVQVQSSHLKHLHIFFFSYIKIILIPRQSKTQLYEW